MLMTAVDTLNQAMVYQAVLYASQGGGAYSRQLNRSPRYLTRWGDLRALPAKLKTKEKSLKTACLIHNQL